MKNKKHNPTRSKITVLHQLCNLIPAHLVPKLARETGVEDKARSYRPWSHVVAMLFAQLTRAIGLNDVCDSFAGYQCQPSKLKFQALCLLLFEPPDSILRRSS